MAKKVREDARRCMKCDYRWWARPAKKPKRMGWTDDFTLAEIGLGAPRATRVAHNRSMDIVEWQRWGLCRRCGSQQIETVPARGFVPTALEQARPSGHQDSGATPPRPVGAPTPTSPSPAPYSVKGPGLGERAVAAAWTQSARGTRALVRVTRRKIQDRKNRTGAPSDGDAYGRSKDAFDER